MAEWFKAEICYVSGGKTPEGSNPSASFETSVSVESIFSETTTGERRDRTVLDRPYSWSSGGNFSGDWPSWSMAAVSKTAGGPQVHPQVRILHLPCLIFWNVAEWIMAASGVATHGLTLSPGASWVRIPPFQTKFGRTVVFFTDCVDDWSPFIISTPNCQKFSEMVVVKIQPEDATTVWRLSFPKSGER